ncbi:S8 family peptidase [Paenibacillus sp. NPDC058071]|uniref:S8 family peptidase n=1 Tax=Paenibacillus sp. NPDC058071 TaxID=3346326 RepID=UPI0036DE8C06
MPQLESILKIHSRNGPSKHTVRKLITFKTGSSYKQCLASLLASGIRPFKRIPGSRMIGCHFDKRLSAMTVNRHPKILRVEQDNRVAMHALHAPLVRSKRREPKRRVKTKNIPLLSTEVASPANLTWNLCAVQAPEAWRKTKGSPIKVAVIDTGIAPHPDLRIAGGINTINGGSYADDNGHGTHVAGIAAAKGLKSVKGVAPEVQLYSVKALDNTGAGYVSDIIDGIEWCIRNRIQVINMSFGIVSGVESKGLHEVIKKAVSRGIVIIASAGNSGPDTTVIDEPACYPETIAVAATTQVNRIASFSSRGEGIDLAAPGNAIRSTWLKGGYRTVSGTSMATPHTTGGVALLLAASPSLTPSQIRAKLRQWAQRLDGAPVTAQGSGLLQLGKIGESQLQ